MGIGAYDCTDHEYALNKVSKKYGGGTEVWRLLAPGMVRGDFYPRTMPGESKRQTSVPPPYFLLTLFNAYS